MASKVCIKLQQGKRTPLDLLVGGRGEGFLHQLLGEAHPKEGKLIRLFYFISTMVPPRALVVVAVGVRAFVWCVYQQPATLCGVCVVCCVRCVVSKMTYHSVWCVRCVVCVYQH